jgi:hypothetical protein
LHVEAGSSNIGRKLSDVIAAWREEVSPGPSIRPEGAWREARRKSDELAARELLGSSQLLAQADALADKATAAQKAADEAKAKVAELWREYTTLPSQIELRQARLADVANERSGLDATALENDFIEIYSARFVGKDVRGNTDLIFAQLAQIELKRRALDKAEPIIKAELAALQARQRQLRKELDQNHETRFERN